MRDALKRLVHTGRDALRLTFPGLSASVSTSLPRFVSLALASRSEAGVGRTGWGQVSVASEVTHETTLYHYTEARVARGGQEVDDGTWADLNLDKVFRRIDHTRSAIGRQVLYRRVRAPTRVQQANSHEPALADAFGESADLRESVGAVLSKLYSRDAFQLPRLFDDEFLSIPRRLSIVRWLALSTLGLLIALALVPGLALVPLLSLILVNVVVGLHYRRRLADMVPPLRTLSKLIVCGERMCDLDRQPLRSYRDQLKRSCDRLGRIRSASSYLALGSSTNELVASAYAYLNTFLLVDLIVIHSALHKVARGAGDVRAVFEAIGSIDAAMSVASYRASLPYFCKPDFSESHTLQVDAIFHPLLDDPVPTSFDSAGRPTIIYGPNNSGKTTFVRAVALNAILASSIDTCTARSFTAPRLRVRSSIQRPDSISLSRGLFLSEVEGMRALIDEAQRADPLLLVVDEPFKGTNHSDRVAIACAVLWYLGRTGHIVLATAHDTEWISFIGTNWDVYHFRGAGALEGGAYRIVHGVPRGDSALPILLDAGYPTEVVKYAEEIRRTGLSQSES